VRYSVYSTHLDRLGDLENFEVINTPLNPLSRGEVGGSSAFSGVVGLLFF